jgi:uncharacterized membrane protein
MASYRTERFFKQVRNTLLTGLLLIIPVAGSMFIFWKVFLLIDRALPAIMGTRWFPGIGFFVTLAVIFLVGLLAKNWFGKKIIATGNSIIISIPFLNKIYMVLKQIIDTITVDKKSMFNRTVLIEFPRKDSYAVGFITSEHNAGFSAKAGRKLVAVFVPTVPNPTSGFLMYIPEEDVIPLDITVEAGFKLIVSVGLLGADKPEGMQATNIAPLHWNWMDIFKRKSNKKRPVPHDPRD